MENEEDKKSIAVIGEREFTVGFELAGVQKTYGKENYREQIQELIEREDLGIIVAEKSDIDELPERIRRKVNESVDPVVVPLSEKAEDSQLQDKIRKVIGVDLS
ncbi:MAG: V/A-type H+-transporting ATPase subunit F [Candidatus Nanohaloarchaea archaeon]|jgi:V/A-type H+-transporting ATPase subunit F